MKMVTSVLTDKWKIMEVQYMSMCFYCLIFKVSVYNDNAQISGRNVKIMLTLNHQEVYLLITVQILIKCTMHSCIR